MYKSALLERFPNAKPILLYALAAVMGDMTGSGWLCPSEVVKQQMQAGMFANTREAVTSIWKNKGLAGLYQGYWGGVARDVPFRVAQLTSYEVTKSLYLRLKQRRQDAKRSNIKRNTNPPLPLQLSSGEAALCGAIAGSFSAAVTSPLDRIKTLLMTNSAAYGGSVSSCAAKIWAEEGLTGFFTGIGPRVIYIAPSVVIFFIAYEQTQQRLQHWKTK
jgi:solute carrier family 25 S-adenosylmethionine transporter 26